MRRRSERKKSTEASPVASSRRSSRRTRRSPDNEKNEDSEQQLDDTPTKTDISPNRASSEEPLENTRRGRASRSTRAPAKRRLRSISGTEKKIDAIAEEENGLTASCEEKEQNTIATEIPEEEENVEKDEVVAEVVPVVENKAVAEHEVNAEEVVAELPVALKEDTEAEAIACEPKSNSNEQQKISEVLMAGTDHADEEDAVEATAAAAADANAANAVDQVEEDKTPETEPSTTEESNTESPLTTSDKIVEEESTTMPTEVLQEKADDSIETRAGRAEKSSVDKSESANEEEANNKTAETVAVEAQQIDSNVQAATQQLNEKETPSEKDQKKQVTTNNNNKSGVNVEQTRTRKRKWLTKKATEAKAPILAISTDSLKNLIADVHPVPLSDVQLESSSEVEEVTSPRGEVIDEGSTSPSDNERRRGSLDNTAKEKSAPAAATVATPAVNAGAVSVPNSLPVHSSPSPPRNQTSSVLYITSLVRPFTVLQLKGLLARTGKIVENGFWIDRIKSKCYVQYETEDEAIETRHALHGVRWPVSNPKCLNVDFAKQVDLERAIQSTSDDAPKYGQDTKDNYITGSGWNREQLDNEDKKRPIREWDVGKKDSLDRDKREVEKLRATKESEREKDDKYKKNRARGRDPRSSSVSPARKVKKENEPPLRLLDDLFRKTKATPCIYWLPLTPEQIAEKEAFRQKRIEERKLRIQQRELERAKENERDVERDRERDRERERERDREQRRNRSAERSRDRRSRSRDRRRY